MHSRHLLHGPTRPSRPRVSLTRRGYAAAVERPIAVAMLRRLHAQLLQHLPTSTQSNCRSRPRVLSNAQCLTANRSVGCDCAFSILARPSPRCRWASDPQARCDTPRTNRPTGCSLASASSNATTSTCCRCCTTPRSLPAIRNGARLDPTMLVRGANSRVLKNQRC